MARDGTWRLRNGDILEGYAPDAGIHLRIHTGIFIPVRISAFPTPRRILENTAAGFPDCSFCTGVRSLYVWPDSIDANGDVSMFAVGRIKFLNGRNCLPYLRDGRSIAEYFMDVPNEALLPHLPALHL